MIIAKTGVTIYEGIECGSQWLKQEIAEAIEKSNPDNWRIESWSEDTSHHHIGSRREGKQTSSEYSKWVCCGKQTFQTPANQPAPWLLWQEDLADLRAMESLSAEELTLRVFGYIPSRRKL